MDNKKRSDAKLLVIGVIVALGIQYFLDGLVYLLYPDDPTIRAGVQLATGLVYVGLGAFWFHNWTLE